LIFSAHQTVILFRENSLSLSSRHTEPVLPIYIRNRIHARMPIMEKRCSKNRRTGCACSSVTMHMQRESECIFALCIQPILEMSRNLFPRQNRRTWEGIKQDLRNANMTKSYTGKLIFQEKVTATLMEIPQRKVGDCTRYFLYTL